MTTSTQQNTSPLSESPTYSGLDPESSIIIGLKKEYYGTTDALEKLDEEFDEFALRNQTIEAFFNFYNKHFYNIDEDTHKDWIVRSGDHIYPFGYKNPITIEIENINQEIIDTQREIDSVTHENFFIVNNIFVMDKNYKDNATAKLKLGNKVYRIQSGRKRKVQDYQTYLNVKIKERSRVDGDVLISDEDYVNFIHGHTLDKFPDGPDIITDSDINISSLEINIYPRTLEEYNGL